MQFVDPETDRWWYKHACQWTPCPDGAFRQSRAFSLRCRPRQTSQVPAPRGRRRASEQPSRRGMAATARGRVGEIRAGDVEAAGLTAADAGAFLAALRSATGKCGADAAAAWAAVVAAGVLRPDHPHALHQLVYYSVYAGWDRAQRD
uniref:Uncharacterized protein n=6 Tax=Aegilops tauschii subsp. strangulata TaxID=200361 RepID=A0A453QMW6_AEGTS